MDLKRYYEKIRETEAAIVEPYPVVRSLETPDGGRGGALTEVPRRLAAKMIVEGQAQLAPKEEAAAFLACQAEAKRRIDEIAAAARIQVTLVPTDELTKLKSKASTTR